MIPFDGLSFWEKELFIAQIDDLIVGSGIVGLSTAIHLKKNHPNRKVCILERGYLPSGASTKNAGFACIGSPTELLDDLQNESEELVFSRLEKRWKGLNYLRELLGDEGIQYESLGSHELFNQTDQTAYRECLDQLNFLNTRLKDITGIAACFQASDSICKNSGFENFKFGISHAAEAQINTGKMMGSLLALARSLDIQILNGIEVERIEEGHVITNHGRLNFRQIAICNNGLAQKLLPSEDIRPARAQVIITKAIENLKIKGIFHFDKGYYYFRNVGQRLLLGGGRNLNFTKEETSSLETSEELISHLKEILGKSLLPNQKFEIEAAWAGTMGLGQSKQPILKQVGTNQFCAVRLGGMGIAIGSLMGKELAELMK